MRNKRVANAKGVDYPDADMQAREKRACENPKCGKTFTAPKIERSRKRYCSARCRRMSFYYKRDEAFKRVASADQPLANA